MLIKTRKASLEGTSTTSATSLPSVTMKFDPRQQKAKHLGQNSLSSKVLARHRFTHKK